MKLHCYNFFHKCLSCTTNQLLKLNKIIRKRIKIDLSTVLKLISKEHIKYLISKLRVKEKYQN